MIGAERRLLILAATVVVLHLHAAPGEHLVLLHVVALHQVGEDVFGLLACPGTVRGSVARVEPSGLHRVAG